MTMILVMIDTLTLSISERMPGMTSGNDPDESTPCKEYLMNDGLAELFLCIYISSL
jgi:hypothetical protein